MDAAELEWLAWTTPITTALGKEVAAADHRGRTIACFQHVVGDTVLIVEPFLRAGARVRIAACNAESTDDRAAEHLSSLGAEIMAWAGMSPHEHADALAWLASEPADALCDMGGELIAAMSTAGHPVIAALEATTSGLHRLTGLDIPFPVLNWNDIPLKELIHNRHHVGAETWPAFTAITGLSLYGREVVVIGFGPVGQGVAQRAREMGAMVTVVDPDPVRSVLALHHGSRVADMDAALATAEIVVTATGVDGVLGPEQLRRISDGAIVMNVGHSDREIDVDWLDAHPTHELRRHLVRHDLGDRRLYLLNRGSLVNLAAELGVVAPQLFDPFSAVMLLGLHAILSGEIGDLPPGVQRYPADLERRIARALVTRGAPER